MNTLSASRAGKLRKYRPSFTRPPPLLSMLLLSLLVFPPAIQAATLPSLGTAIDFAVLGGSAVTNTGTTTVTGDLGVSPGTAATGFPPGIITGTTYTGAVSNAGPAQTDALGAYNDAAGQACDTDLTGVDLGTMTLTPGAYCFDTEAQLTGTLTLDFLGDSSAVFLFQMGSTLITANNAVVVAINGSPSFHNVVWQVGSSATLGLDTQFLGDIIALTSIGATTGASINGSLYALNGAVTLDTNTIVAGATECTVDAECADGNACTDEVCNPGIPGSDPFGCARTNNLDPCDDGLFCNGTDACSGGTCGHTGDPCVGGDVCGDTCSEVADNCFDPAGTTCRAAAGVCDSAETCTGSSEACPADGFLSGVCRASGGVCDMAESCTGSSAACPADVFLTNLCRASTGICDEAETCSGTSADCPADLFVVAGTICRADSGVCDVAETCTGISGACPSDSFDPLGAACSSDGNICTDDECNGLGTCNHLNNTDPCDDGLFCTGTDTCAFGSCSHAGDPCTGGGICGDTCNEAVDSCLEPAGTVCRAAAGACDIAETCTGSSTTCPADAFLNTLCRASNGVCDVAETCTGSSPACPADAFLSSQCRASSGVCDVPETCTGSSADCPADAFLSSECRASNGVCDAPETCTGSSADCPADTFLSSQCRASNGVCDPAENCTGSSADCPANQFLTAATICRADLGPCDVAERCTGASAVCPANDFEPGGTACNTDNNVCTDDICSGWGTCTHPTNSSLCTDAESEGCSVSLQKIHSGNDNAGGEIRYTLQWSNSCHVDRADVTISDPIPPGLQLLSASSSDATASISGNTAIFSVPALQAMAVGQGFITARIDPDTETGATIRNVATAEVGPQQLAAATNIFRVRGGSTDAARLSCALRAQVYARPGRYVKYEARYWNGSDQNEITLTLPDQVTIVWFYPQPTRQEGNTLTWTDLPPTAGKVTVNTLVSATALDETMVVGSFLLDDNAGNVALCEHVGVVNRSEKLFASIRAQTFSRPGSVIRYTARYREAVGSNQMTISLPNEVTVTRISPRPTSQAGGTLVWTDLPTPSGAVKIDGIVDDVSDGTVLVGSVAMTDESAALFGTEHRTVVTSGNPATGTGNDRLALTLGALRSVTAGTTTDISIRYYGLQGPGAVELELPAELTPVLAVPAADFVAKTVLWTGLPGSSGSMKLRAGVEAGAASGKALVVRGSVTDANGVTVAAQASTTVRD